jgi:RNA polymerase sigma-70 factor (ECF subfamily)
MHSKDVYRYAYSLLKNSEDADDVVQDVFMNYLNKSGSFRGKCSLKTWLLVLTRNQCYNVIKSRKIRRTEPIEDVILVSDNKYVEDKLNIEDALKTLTTEENEIIFLREYSGFTYIEISLILGISVDNVKVRLFRAKQKLRKALYDY